MLSTLIFSRNKLHSTRFSSEQASGWAMSCFFKAPPEDARHEVGEDIETKYTAVLFAALCEWTDQAKRAALVRLRIFIIFPTKKKPYNL